MNIVEITKVTRNEYGNGLNTRLVFNRKINLKEDNSREVEINTGIVLKNEKNPYVTMVSTNNITNIGAFNQRYSREEYFDRHFDLVNKFRSDYLKGLKKSLEKFGSTG